MCIQIKTEDTSWHYEAAPCELCPNAALCRGGLACRQFESFVAHGGRRWAAQPRDPTPAIYAQIFRPGVRGVSV
jgi:hypothetical protein